MNAIVYAAAFLASIVAANVATATIGLVPIGLGLTVTAGTFAAGVALVARDGVQRTARTPLPVALIIAAGCALSWLLATPALAVASALAFTVSELIDWGIFTRLQRNLPVAVVVSSLAAAPVDTVLFLWIAGFGVTWQAVLGQVLVKTAIALAVAGLLTYRSRRDVPVWG